MDTTAFSERLYVNGVVRSNGNYVKNKASGIHWYPGDTIAGSHWILFDGGVVTMRTYFYPNSGIPQFVSTMQEDGTWHSTTYYPSGNPRWDGKELNDPSGSRVARTRTEYDSTGYGYSIGKYYPVEIADTTYTSDEYTGDMVMIVQTTMELRHGIWIQYDGAGKRIGTRTYEMGVLVSRKED